MMMISSISSPFNSECVLYEIITSFICMIVVSVFMFFCSFPALLFILGRVHHTLLPPSYIFIAFFLQFCPFPLVISFSRIAMETYIRQRQLIMSPLIPSRVIGENEPLVSVFNKVIATREVNHKGQGKSRPIGQKI